MKDNVGGNDRIARFAAGSALALYGLSTDGWRRWLAWSMAGSLLGTASIKKCLLNSVLEINSNAEASRERQAIVEEASEESFPASDAPAYTAGPPN